MAPSTIEADVAAINRISVVPTILEAVARTTGMRFAAVARVTDTKWTACAVYDLIEFGLEPGGELVLETTICNEIRQHHQSVVFGHASAHPHFAKHPTPKMYGFESYISIPIFRSNGELFGTLCAIDPLPAKLEDSNVVTTLELFAKLIAAHLDIDERLTHADSELFDAQQTAKLREQFIAVLGHDLRNPIQAVLAGVAVLEHDLPEPRAKRVMGNIKRSCDRMAEMIDNVLDFARGRLGGGIQIALEKQETLGDDFSHVIDEIRGAHPSHAIEAHMAIERPFVCDRRRLAQLLGNLLANAVTHGTADSPIRVQATTDGDKFELSVTNAGTPIPTGDFERLFKPFNRGESATGAQGLGLGLYICAEIAKAHAGTLIASSSQTDRLTSFIFRMPIDVA